MKLNRAKIKENFAHKLLNLTKFYLTKLGEGVAIILTMTVGQWDTIILHAQAQ